MTIATVSAGIILNGDEAGPLRIGCIGLILVGVIGLKLLSGR